MVPRADYLAQVRPLNDSPYDPPPNSGSEHDPFDPSTDPSAPAWQRWMRQPALLLVLAAVALTVGVWMSGNASRGEAEREALPPRADCRAFPGACAAEGPTAPPPELAALAAEVETANATWQQTLERERRTGVFPEKGLVDLRDALGNTDAAIRDAAVLFAAAAATGEEDARREALDALRGAYDAKRALLERATRLLEQAT